MPLSPYLAEMFGQSPLATGGYQPEPTPAARSVFTGALASGATPTTASNPLAGLAALFGGAQPRRSLNISGVESNNNLTSNEDWARMFHNTGVLGGTMHSSLEGMSPQDQVFARNTNLIAMAQARAANQGKAAPLPTTMPIATFSPQGNLLNGAVPFATTGTAPGIYSNGRPQKLMPSF